VALEAASGALARGAGRLGFLTHLHTQLHTGAHVTSEKSQRRPRIFGEMAVGDCLKRLRKTTERTRVYPGFEPRIEPETSQMRSGSADTR
jgi:hypothetical protein